MQWDDDLLKDQKKAASYIKGHACLLAGPGTGKTLTLTRHVVYLVSKADVPPEKILVLTFTRAATSELRKRIIKMLGEQKGNLVHISTLHSFALQQLLKNSNIVDLFPKPLRVADDWEERNIIFEDLKSILKYNKIENIKERFNMLSSNWQKLPTDEEKKNLSIDPQFLGAWQQHRKIFGYTLRSELVYLLKKALEQIGKFSLDSQYSYLLIDEYQDLNACDLSVIHSIANKGIKIFAAGDDDQSIYGFRYAQPEGIRKFNENYKSPSLFTLSTCMRCDRKIIDLASFVANLDPDRIPKKLNPRNDADDGEVYILRFKNQLDEANGVATICKYLLDQKGYNPNEILILMRSDRNNAFSSIIKKELKSKNIPASTKTKNTLLYEPFSRIFLSYLHLLVNNKDSLALRTLLSLRKNGVGKESFAKIYNIARENGNTFSESAYSVMKKPELISHSGKKIAEEIQKIQNILNKHQQHFNILYNSSDPQDLLNALDNFANDPLVNNSNKTDKVLQFLKSIISETNVTNHKELLRTISSSMENTEQELDSKKVNIMTMHKAKGLTSKAVIIIGAEDEYIPGKQIGKMEDDERRLLYVSLSRAKHFLAITYCERRTGQQKHTGRNNKNSHRTLTRFLRDAKISPVGISSSMKELKTLLLH